MCLVKCVTPPINFDNFEITILTQFQKLSKNFKIKFEGIWAEILVSKESVKFTESMLVETVLNDLSTLCRHCNRFS